MKSFRLLLLCLSGFVALSAANAQFSVQLSIKERLYILHEPLIATVDVTNNTGSDVTLQDTGTSQWFGFRIKGADDTLVPPRNLEYHLAPLTVRAGETVRRSVNLNKLYELGEFGIYSIRAEIYCSALDRFFTSRPATMELTEGRKLWKQVVGVPAGMPNAGQMHVFTLLAHQRGDGNLLFCRVEDQDSGTIYCTFPVARMVDGAVPETQFDSSNNLYILQLIGQKSYSLIKVSPNGEFLGETGYSAERSRPFLRKLADGSLQLVGGARLAQGAPAPGSAAPHGLSERPPGLPIATPSH